MRGRERENREIESEVAHGKCTRGGGGGGGGGRGGVIGKVGTKIKWGWSEVDEEL